jgi:hypothetical protein
VVSKISDVVFIYRIPGTTLNLGIQKSTPQGFNRLPFKTTPSHITKTSLSFDLPKAPHAYTRKSCLKRTSIFNDGDPAACSPDCGALTEYLSKRDAGGASGDYNRFALYNHSLYMANVSCLNKVLGKASVPKQHGYLPMRGPKLLFRTLMHACPYSTYIIQSITIIYSFFDMKKLVYE